MNTWKKIISISLVVLLTVWGICKLGYYVRPVNTDVCIATIETFHDMPENSFEVIGYGSSHMWKGMNPKELYKQYGIGAYNYGCDWQQLNTTLLFLKDSLRTQKPKVVLIETYFVAFIKENQNMDGEIYYTTAIDDFDGKREYLKRVFGDEGTLTLERYLSYYVPLCAFHDNWIDICQESFKENIGDGYDFYSTMGFYPSDKITPITLPDSGAAAQSELPPDSIEILDEIVALCKENDIDIIFYTAPWQGDFPHSDAMKSYASKNDCVYFNLFEYADQIGFDENADFSDDAHLNTSGANKVADFLGEYIINNYDVTDFREVANNLWDTSI